MPGVGQMPARWGKMVRTDAFERCCSCTDTHLLLVEADRKIGIVSILVPRQMEGAILVPFSIRRWC